jgi:hypothetical protein
MPDNDLKLDTGKYAQGEGASAERRFSRDLTVAAESFQAGYSDLVISSFDSLASHL